MSDRAHPLMELTLARLLMPGRKPPAPSAVLKDLAPLIRGGLTKDRIADVIAELRALGLLPAKGQVLTEAGRARALKYLGLAELPPKCNWGTVRAKYLIPKALGLNPWSDAESASVGSEVKLAARLLKDKYALSVPADTGLPKVLEALVCRLLGYPESADFDHLKANVLSREAGAVPPLPVGDVKSVAPRLLLGSKKRGVDGYRAVVLNATFEDQGASHFKPVPEAKPVPADKPVPVELKTFVKHLTDAAGRSPTGWFGDDLVFISHVWKHVRNSAEFQTLDFVDFQGKLIAANRAQLLTLSRADLVQAMDSTDIKESETSYLNSVFHFIRIRRAL